jgi:hypothetical protein
MKLLISLLQLQGCNLKRDKEETKKKRRRRRRRKYETNANSIY